MTLLSLLFSIVAMQAPSDDASPTGALKAHSYETCATLAVEDPTAGLVYAEVWQSHGGSRAARHCYALAAIGLGKEKSAALMLRDLAADAEKDPGIATRFHLQAAEAFAAAGDHAEAAASLDAARGLAPDAPEIAMAAAGIHEAAENWDGVVRAVTALEAVADLSADAYALRGRARFHMGQMQGAANDAARALRLESGLIDALLLRGDLLNRGQALPNDPISERP